MVALGLDESNRAAANMYRFLETIRQIEGQKKGMARKIERDKNIRQESKRQAKLARKAREAKKRKIA